MRWRAHVERHKKTCASLFYWSSSTLTSVKLPAPLKTDFSSLIFTLVQHLYVTQLLRISSAAAALTSSSVPYTNAQVLLHTSAFLFLIVLQPEISGNLTDERHWSPCQHLHGGFRLVNFKRQSGVCTCWGLRLPETTGVLLSESCRAAQNKSVGRHINPPWKIMSFPLRTQEELDHFCWMRNCTAP